MAEEVVVARREDDSNPGDEEARNLGSPIVLDLGKHKRKRVKSLRKGRGKLMEKVADVLTQLKTEGVVSGSTQPVVVVVRERRRSRGRWMGL